MKTIKFLHYVKYPVLLFIAFFGILIGGQQTAPRRLADIGGNSAGGNAPRRFVSNDYAEIGGGQTSPRMALLSGSVAGVQSPPRSYSAANIGDIGGGQAAPPSHFPKANSSKQYSNYGFWDSSYDFEIGGQTTHGSEFRQFVSAEIGGGQTAPRQLEIGGQTVPSTRPLMLAVVEDTGSNYVPKATSLVNRFIEIGGAQGAPRTS